MSRSPRQSAPRDPDSKLFSHLCRAINAEEDLDKAEREIKQLRIKIEEQNGHIKGQEI